MKEQLLYPTPRKRLRQWLGAVKAARIAKSPTLLRDPGQVGERFQKGVLIPISEAVPSR